MRSITNLAAGGGGIMVFAAAGGGVVVVVVVGRTKTYFIKNQEKSIRPHAPHSLDCVLLTKAHVFI